MNLYKFLDKFGKELRYPSIQAKYGNRGTVKEVYLVIVIR